MPNDIQAGESEIEENQDQVKETDGDYNPAEGSAGESVILVKGERKR